MAALLHRRASSCPLVPIATRSLASFYALHLRHPLFSSRFLPFSTSSADSPSLETSDKSPTISYHKLFEKVVNEIASCSNELVPLPSGFPFELSAYPGSEEIYMKRRYLNERIEVVIRNDLDYQINDDDPSIPLHVIIDARNALIRCEMTLRPEQLDIHEFVVSEYYDNAELEEYLKNKGLTSKTISRLYDLLVFKKKDGAPLKA